jgi:hypothetical protein
MKELYGLKDMEGNEYKIFVTEEELIILKVVLIRKAESKFKIGEWAVGIHLNSPRDPKKIASFDEWKVIFEDGDWQDMSLIETINPYILKR